MNNLPSFTGSYFMSEETEMAAKGRLLENYKTVTGKLANLQEEATAIGEALSCVGWALKNSPEKIMRVTGENQVHVAGGPFRTTVDISKFQPENLMRLVTDITDLSQRRDEIKARIEANGVKIS